MTNDELVLKSAELLDKLKDEARKQVVAQFGTPDNFINIKSVISQFNYDSATVTAVYSINRQDYSFEFVLPYRRTEELVFHPYQKTPLTGALLDHIEIIMEFQKAILENVSKNFMHQLSKEESFTKTFKYWEAKLKQELQFIEETHGKPL